MELIVRLTQIVRWMNGAKNCAKRRGDLRDRWIKAFTRSNLAKIFVLEEQLVSSNSSLRYPIAADHLFCFSLIPIRQLMLSSQHNLLESTHVPRHPLWCGLWQVTGIRREEAKVTRSLKEAAKKGDKDVCKILARSDTHLSKCNGNNHWISWAFSPLGWRQISPSPLCREVVNSRKAVNKIYAAKANLNSVQLQMKGQLAQVNFLSNIGWPQGYGNHWPYFIRI